jgi:hypothetical protein
MRMRTMKLVAAIVVIACVCAILGLAYLRTFVFKAPPSESMNTHARIAATPSEMSARQVRGT